jgi:hypothetical protein
MTDYDQDDIVWADKNGNLTNSGFPFCQSCLPPQPICGDCLIPLNQCQHARDYVLSNNDKKVLRLIGSSLMTKQVNK